ncbi:MAG: pilus assembly protein PilM [Deltaproteobacteria bacterium]|nr:pilus assembly protein PilM [Deltaproteobacteria bacterium]
MAQKIVGIDIGAESVKVVHLVTTMRGYSVTAFDEEPLPEAAFDPEKSPAGGDGPAAETFFGRARQALLKLRERGALHGDLFVTGLPGEFASTRLVRLPFDDAKRIEATLPFEVESQIPFDLDDVVLASQVLSGHIGGQTDVLVGVARKRDVADYLALLKSVGIDPRQVEFDALALGELHRQLLAHSDTHEPVVATPGGTVIERGPTAYPSATAIVDIGRERTAICIVAAEQAVAARTILRGGIDLTRALAKEFGLSMAEAETGKRREAFIEVAGSPAAYPEQQRISACLTAALQPIVREIRQSIQAALAQRRVRVARIFLCGGGGRVPNLDLYLAAQLNVDVRWANEIRGALAPVLNAPPGGQPPDMLHAAKALAYALCGYVSSKSERLDFRQGDFAYRGDFEFLEGHVAQIAAGLMVVALLLGLNGYASHFSISRQETALVKRQQEACQKILGREMKSAERCLAMMQEQIKLGPGGAGMPKRTVIDAYLELARATPKGTMVKVDELEISLERIRVKGTTDSYEAVDKIVEGLQKGRCFTNVQKGSARQSGDKVSFGVTIDLSCSGQPTDGAAGSGTPAPATAAPGKTPLEPGAAPHAVQPAAAAPMPRNVPPPLGMQRPPGLPTTGFKPPTGPFNPSRPIAPQTAPPSGGGTTH